MWSNCWRLRRYSTDTLGYHWYQWSSPRRQVITKNHHFFIFSCCWPRITFIIPSFPNQNYYFPFPQFTFIVNNCFTLILIFFCSIFGIIWLFFFYFNVICSLTLTSWQGVCCSQACVSACVWWRVRRTYRVFFWFVFVFVFGLVLFWFWFWCLFWVLFFMFWLCFFCTYHVCCMRARGLKRSWMSAWERAGLHECICVCPLSVDTHRFFVFSGGFCFMCFLSCVFFFVPCESARACVSAYVRVDVRDCQPACLVSAHCRRVSCRFYCFRFRFRFCFCFVSFFAYHVLWTRGLCLTARIVLFSFLFFSFLFLFLFCFILFFVVQYHVCVV